MSISLINPPKSISIFWTFTSPQGASIPSTFSQGADPRPPPRRGRRRRGGVRGVRAGAAGGGGAARLRGSAAGGGCGAAGGGAADVERYSQIFFSESFQELERGCALCRDDIGSI